MCPARLQLHEKIGCARSAQYPIRGHGARNPGNRHAQQVECGAAADGFIHGAADRFMTPTHTRDNSERRHVSAGAAASGEVCAPGGATPTAPLVSCRGDG